MSKFTKEILLNEWGKIKWNNIMQLKQKLMFQCHILSEHCVLASSNTRFFKVIYLIIYSHEHKVQDHHRVQTQIIHREWVITFINKVQINKDVIKIHYKIIYNITQLTTIHITTLSFKIHHRNHQSHYTWITHSSQNITTLPNFIINN